MRLLTGTIAELARVALIGALVIGGGISLAGCPENTTVEETSEEAPGMFEDAGTAIDDAVDDVGGAVDDAVDATGDAVDGAADEIEEMADELEDEL